MELRERAMGRYNLRRKINRKWILLAHRSKARLFTASGATIELVREFDHPEGRRKNREIDTDAKGSHYSTVAGRTAPRAPFHSRQQKHGFDPRLEAVEHLTDVFAKELCRELYRGRTRREFDELVVVAEAGFLGKVRRFLDKETRGRLVDQIPQNWIDLPKLELKRRLERLIKNPSGGSLTRAA